MEIPTELVLIELGRIICRLQQAREVIELGRFFRRKLMKHNTLAFVVKEQDQPAKKEHLIKVTDAVVERMTKQGTFEIRTTIHITNKLAESEVLLYVDQDQVFPISGFPRSLADDEKQNGSK
jgi:hypothetical protein